MTIANQRGGFLKTLEINRDGSASSETNLKDTFLKKTEGYVMQVTRFVVNNSPPLNLIDEPMFTVLRRGGSYGYDYTTGDSSVDISTNVIQNLPGTCSATRKILPAD